MSGLEAGERLSRMTLGTVQFGMTYGVANRTGQPEYREVLRIVELAVESGVNCFDTAACYGSAEQVLGRALAELGVADRVMVVTKVSPLPPEHRSDRSAAEALIVGSIERSRQRLGIDRLPLVLFHRQEDAVHCDVLERLRDRGRLQAFGVSCQHEPDVVSGILADSRVAAVQLPANLLDRRHQQHGIFDQAAARDAVVFIRSVYLQGLLLMPEAEIPAELIAVIPVRRRLEAVADEAGIGFAELAARYLLSQSGVASVLVGVETLDQLRENLAVFGRGALDADTLAAIDAVAFELADQVITPASWSA